MVTLPLIKVEILTFSTPNIRLQWYFNIQVFDFFGPSLSNHVLLPLIRFDSASGCSVSTPSRGTHGLLLVRLHDLPRPTYGDWPVGWTLSAALVSTIPLSHEHGLVGGIVGNSHSFVTPALFGLVHVVGNWHRQRQFHLLFSAWRTKSFVLLSSSTFVWQTWNDK